MEKKSAEKIRLRKNLLIWVCALMGGVGVWAAPHESQVQSATDEQAYVQNMMHSLRSLGPEEYFREEFRYFAGIGKAPISKALAGGPVLSGTQTTDPGTTRYNAGLNPSNANSWISRIYARTALEDLKNFRKPARSYMTSTLIRYSTETWNAAISRKIQARAEEVGSDLGAE